MKNTLEKIKNKEYNLDIVNIYGICENNNPYGHIEEFMKLSTKEKCEAHRVISSQAILSYSEGLIYDVVIDVNGNLYYFEIFSDSSYRVTDVKKSKESIKEVANETNTN